MARSYPGVYAYKTANGTLYRFAYRDSAGKQSSKRGFPSPQAAFQAKTKLTGKINEGVVHVAVGNFGDFFTAWLRSRKPFVTAGTYLDYETHAKNRLLPTFAAMRLDKVTRADVREWLVECDESGQYSPKSINNALAVLVTCLNQAAEDRLIAVNPAAGIQRLPEGHVERDYLRIEEIDRYLEACSEVYRPLAELLVTCGLRISEALGVIWADIDFDHQVVVVYRQAKAQRGETGATKGQRFRRVEAGPDLLKRLADLKATRAEMVAAEIGSQAVFVMPVRVGKHDRGCYAGSGDGEAMNRNTVSRDWHKETLADAGIRDLPLHGLRHTAAASWLYAGQPLIYVQRQLGHSSITTTERYYGHLEQGFLKTAAKDTEAAIRAAGLRATERLG